MSSLVGWYWFHLLAVHLGGEKYELAKKVNIKLINHQWLEDCLKAWEILPLDNYTKSGWEVEVLKAEAKDSDEEADVGMKSLENSSTRKSSFGVERSTAVGSDLSIQSLKGLRFPKVLDTTVVSAFAGNTTNDALFTTPCKDNGSRNDTCNVTRKGCEKDVRNYVQANGNHGIRETMIDAELFNRPHSDIKEAHSLSSETASTSKVLDVKSGNLTYPRRPQSQSVSPEPLVHIETSKPFADEVNSDISLSEEKASRPGDESSNLQGLTSQDGRRNLTTPKSVFPQKRKLSVSGGVSKSPKSECQSSTHSQQYPSPNTRSTDQACNVSPQDKKDPEQLMGTDHPMKDAVFSTSASKQAAFSRFNSIAYKNKSSRHEKLRIENNSNDVFTPLSKNETEICSSKQALVEQKSRKENSPNAERMVTDVSLSDSKGLLNLSLDHGKMQVDDHRDIMRTTGNQSGSLAIGELTDGAFCNGGRPEMSTGDLEEPELGTKSLSGGTANSKQILVSEEHNHSHRSAQGKTSLSPDGRASVNGNSSCILNTDAPKRNNVIVASIARTRKTVAKMSFSSRSKLNEKKNSEDKIVLDPDKAPMIAEISKAEMKVTEDKKQSGNLKGGLVESFSVGNVLPERTEAAGCPMPTSTTKAVSMDVAKQAPLVDAEKNMPEEAVRFNPNRGKNQKNKLLKTGDQELLHSSNRSKMGTKNRKISNLEPSWFIVSGHRVQRKEFQAMIKRLRGRVCRDSHHWSFQATHFITPEPVRRTEKFFAAAAAGRWILKPDYLTASCEAGRLLDEESYEYYSKGLTEDGAISLEAPRKWRILRQRTGHGAFYKMRIVIYGECIAPTLDTLKRVIKAGDGTILATSPPYSRFLKSGFDFAVVSPSMPRVDSWVQEFLRHEIPCIAADYLVEYACKPGYSLERHVLYKTHSWANKSFENLLRCSEEIIEDCTMSSDESSDDLSCAVCGSRDRGEVMLICGDEAGKVGCGIGTHIDCCDPPLQSVPEDDWLCSKCSSTPNIAPFKKRQPKRSSKR